MNIRFIYASPNSWLPNIACVNKLLHQLSPEDNIAELTELELTRSFVNQYFFLLCVISEKGNAQDDYELVGMGSIFLQKNVGGWMAEIHDIIVSDTCRGQGLGRAIVSRLIQIAKHHAAKEGKDVKVSLTSRPSRVAANKLYESLGFVRIAEALNESGTNLYKLVIDSNGNFSDPALKNKNT